jgi:hypothetical protein
VSQRIDVEVDGKGQVKIEFSGFSGDTCFEESEVLCKMLESMGLWAIPVSVTPKSSTQIDDELGQDMQTQSKRKVSIP